MALESIFVDSHSAGDLGNSKEANIEGAIVFENLSYFANWTRKNLMITSIGSNYFIYL